MSVMTKGREEWSAMLERAADEALLRFLAKHGRVEAWIRDAVEEYVREHKVTASAPIRARRAHQSAVADPTYLGGQPGCRSQQC